MANIKSAQKRIRQTEKRTAVNTARRSRIRTYIRKVIEAVKAENIDEAKTALRLAQSEIMRGVSKGVLHKNTASRKVSRLSAMIKKADLAKSA